MKRTRSGAAGKSRQSGYALLLVVFLVTLLLFSAIAASPDILTEGRREKEKEMVWRGKQYVRGIKLFYLKTGRFPTSMDDLTKPQMGSLRFMRQAYKDPMNKEDGSWRLIYVGPAGQLIGSLKPPQQNMQMPQGGGFGTPAAAMPGASGQSGFSSSSSFGSSFGTGGAQTAAPTGAAGSGAAAPGATSSTAFGSTPSAPSGTGTGTASGTDQPNYGDNPDTIPMGDTPTVMGGSIIGVGGKINKRSIMVYEKAKNYRLFEFVWDPSKDNPAAGQPGMQTGTGLGQAPGQSPFGQQPASGPAGPQPGAGPQPSPQPPQNPPQQQ